MATTKLRARSLVLRNDTKNVSRLAATPSVSVSATSSEVTDPPLAGPGDVQLINYYKPALEGGVYRINVNQRIDLPAGPYPAATQSINSPPDNPGTQSFRVLAPRFSIDANDIHSTYPPQGHADQPMILPHLVFNDPHLPWERSVSVAKTFSDDDVMPWLAVIPFDINATATEPELRLTASQLNGPSAVLPPSQNSATVQIEQSTTCTIRMPLSQYLQLDSRATASGTSVHIPPFAQDLDWANLQNDSTLVDVVFLSGLLFNGLFRSRSDASRIDTTQYRYCAHVRNINTQGMADAGVEDTGLFGILHSLRTGPTDIAQNTAPRTQAVHLLNLEYIEKMAVPAAGDLVALVSLYSWTYLCQPPLSVNFVDAMRNIGDQMKAHSSMLRYSDASIGQLFSSAGQGAFQSVTDVSEHSTLQTVMKERFANGYSLVRHRTAPGQVSVAFTRSPLVPVIVERPAALPQSSHNGQDYQILDQRVGIVDISYSTAFQYGKTLASADMAFVAALMRIRSDVHRSASIAANAAVVSAHFSTVTKVVLMNSLSDTTNDVRSLSNASSRSATPNLRERWTKARAPIDSGIKGVRSPAWREAFSLAAKGRLGLLASAAPAAQRTMTARSLVTESSTVAQPAALATLPSTTPYGDQSTPYSTDWAYLHNWILDKLYLDAIPGHYLISDPAHLPVESIRFFHIDSVWLDCLIDGALSVANHLSRDDDEIRQYIKAEMNTYLSTPQVSTGLLPQVPLYGFFLRSAVVKVFPDLQVTVPYQNVQETNAAPILAQRRLASDVLMVLLDRLPDTGQMASMRFTQPVHQQCFSAGDSLDARQIEFLFRKVYRSAASQSAATDSLHEFGKPHSFARTDSSRIAYDWTSRCLDFATIEQALFSGVDGLVAAMPSEWGSPVQALLTSSMTGIQLNDTIKYLEILAPPNLVTSPAGIHLPRQLYVGSQTPVAPMVLTTTGEPVQIASGGKSPTMRSSLKVKMESADTSAHTSVPTITQRLPRLLPYSSAISQPSSLAKTPTYLNTIDGVSGVSRVPTTGTTPSPVITTPIPSTTGIAAGAIGSVLGGIGATSATLPILTNPFPYPPPLPQLPQFDYAIYPSTLTYSKSLFPPRYVETTNPFPPDIVFSINLKSLVLPALPQALQLHEIDFRIPIGDASLRKNLGSDIMLGGGLVPVDSSPGSAARMLSNQRWVVHMDVEAAYLNLRIIPRTLNLAVPIQQNRSLSFKLNEVEIAGREGKTVTSGRLPVYEYVNIAITEIYGFYADAARTVWINQGSAQQQISLQRK
ncbi:MAG: hypothetical protein Q9168_003378 [Polycauliona sp. 1 TL-2023]